MSARSWFWRELGLDRTDDLRAIRRAYAAKLRAIDPDADADAFQRLRDAREYALADAAHFSAPADDFAFEDDLAFGEGCSESLPLSDHASPSVVLDDQAASPGEATDELDEPYRRLFALLLPEPPREEPLEPAEEADLCSAFQSILADPRLSGIAFHAEVEEWLSHVLASAIPWSDPLIPTAAERFGWLGDAGTISQTPAVAALTDRLDELRFVEEVQSPGHKHHRAWRELTSPADERTKKPWGSGRRVHDLLYLVRTRYPRLEGYFNWYRVALHEQPPRFEFKGWQVALGIWLIFQVLRVVLPSGPDPVFVPEVRASVLSSPQPDIDYALEALFEDDLTLSQVQADNAALYALLEKKWDAAYRMNASRQLFAGQVRDMLLERHQGALMTAGYPVLADHLRLTLEETIAARSRGWQACADLMSGATPAPKLPDRQARRRRALVARTLLETKGDVPDPPNGPIRFAIPGKVVDDVARRSGLKGDELAAALTDQGPAEQQCRARIALYQSVLALPRSEGLPLLRKL